MIPGLPPWQRPGSLSIPPNPATPQQWAVTTECLGAARVKITGKRSGAPAAGPAAPTQSPRPRQGGARLKFTGERGGIPAASLDDFTRRGLQFARVFFAVAAVLIG